jgi:hypothetical protein
VVEIDIGQRGKAAHVLSVGCGKSVEENEAVSVTSRGCRNRPPFSSSTLGAFGSSLSLSLWFVRLTICFYCLAYVSLAPFQISIGGCGFGVDKYSRRSRVGVRGLPSLRDSPHSCFIMIRLGWVFISTIDHRVQCTSHRPLLQLEL